MREIKRLARKPRKNMTHVGLLPIFHYAQIDSTNSEAERLLATGELPPFVVIADEQTRGRGRCGRCWRSHCHGNLYASFAFRASCSVAELHLFTLWMGVRLCDFFNTQLQTSLKVKWPNDLFYAGRKVAGMLTETRLEGDRLSSLIFGLGLNVNDDPSVAAPELAGSASYLAEAVGRSLPFESLTASVIDAVAQSYTAFREVGYKKLFWTLWARYDALKGKAIAVNHSSGQQLFGTVEGLSEEGALRLRDTEGRIVTMHAGDVVIPATVAR